MNASSADLGGRFQRVIDELDLSLTEIAKRLGVDYTALSAFNHERRRYVPGRKPTADYVRVLEEMTGRTASELGLADLLEAEAA